MSIIAAPQALVRAAADTPARRLRRFLLQPAALGLALALLAALLLGNWFHRQAASGIETDRQQRLAIIEANALADAVVAAMSAEAAREAAGEAPDEQAVQRVVSDWVARSASDDQARVLRNAGARLLASTFPSDRKGELPRRLGKDEKWLFDLGQELRAAAETNRSEGIFRKPQIDVSRNAPGRLRVTVPYATDGEMAGFVQFDRPVPASTRIARPLPALLGVLLPVALLLGAALLFTRSLAEPTGRSRWVLYVLALLLLAATWWLQASRAQADLDARVVAADSEVATYATDLAGRLGASGAGRWDVDIFQRPLGQIGADGRVVAAAATTAAAAVKGPLGRALWGNLALGALILSFFALGLARRVRETLAQYRYAYGYVAPAMIGMLILVFFPFIYGIALSFTGQTIFNTNQPLTELWVGLQNYIDVLGGFDVARHSAEGWLVNYNNFYWTLFITIAWTLSNVLLGVTLGMLLALALNTPDLKFKAVYRVLLILPWAIPNYITALIWKALFHQQFGAINQAIQMFGGEPVAWFDGVFSSFLTGLATNGWLSFPFMMVVILGGLQSISADMYEAATVEGATSWQQFKKITLPLLKPTLVPAVILSVVCAFNMFNVIYLVSAGQPAGANEILITKAYKIAFEEYRYGYSAAYSVVIFMILLVYGVFQTRMTRATEAVNT
jgi:arabinogalactan oligomer/maltooligosaccharide transport system permease protein